MGLKNSLKPLVECKVNFLSVVRGYKHVLVVVPPATRTRTKQRDLPRRFILDLICTKVESFEIMWNVVRSCPERLTVLSSYIFISYLYWSPVGVKHTTLALQVPSSTNWAPRDHTFIGNLNTPPWVWSWRRVWEWSKSQHTGWSCWSSAVKDYHGKAITFGDSSSTRLKILTFLFSPFCSGFRDWVWKALHTKDS